MYTVIMMSSRGNSVRQYVIGKGYILLFSALLLGGISGIGYGLSRSSMKRVPRKDYRRVGKKTIN